MGPWGLGSSCALGWLCSFSSPGLWTSSPCIPRNAESQVPLETYYLRICIFTKSRCACDAHECLVLSAWTSSAGWRKKASERRKEYGDGWWRKCNKGIPTLLHVTFLCFFPKLSPLITHSPFIYLFAFSINILSRASYVPGWRYSSEHDRRGPCSHKASHSGGGGRAKQETKKSFKVREQQLLWIITKRNRRMEHAGMWWCYFR